MSGFVSGGSDLWRFQGHYSPVREPVPFGRNPEVEPIPLLFETDEEHRFERSPITDDYDAGRSLPPYDDDDDEDELDFELRDEIFVGEEEQQRLDECSDPIFPPLPPALPLPPPPPPPSLSDLDLDLAFGRRLSGIPPEESECETETETDCSGFLDELLELGPSVIHTTPMGGFDEENEENEEFEFPVLPSFPVPSVVPVISTKKMIQDDDDENGVGVQEEEEEDLGGELCGSGSGDGIGVGMGHRCWGEMGDAVVPGGGVVVSMTLDEMIEHSEQHPNLHCCFESRSISRGMDCQLMPKHALLRSRSGPLGFRFLEYCSSSVIEPILETRTESDVRVCLRLSPDAVRGIDLDSCCVSVGLAAFKRWRVTKRKPHTRYPTAVYDSASGEYRVQVEPLMANCFMNDAMFRVEKKLHRIPETGEFELQFSADRFARDLKHINAGKIRGYNIFVRFVVVLEDVGNGTALVVPFCFQQHSPSQRKKRPTQKRKFFENGLASPVYLVKSHTVCWEFVKKLLLHGKIVGRPSKNVEGGFGQLAEGCCVTPAVPFTPCRSNRNMDAARAALSGKKRARKGTLDEWSDSLSSMDGPRHKRRRLMS